ncbi:PerC family transcriptional regulator [Salmonella enterica subsp. enterica serovar Braenderup]|nr:PerC family transcriptional regulator [Salmonella enterica subsp. enterica serovar Braenderup]
MIHDEKAEKLEQAGFYRRAAVRWLTVLDNCRDAISREWVTRHRLWCLQQAETRRPLTDTFGDVRKAATELQKSLTSSPTFALRDSGGGFPLVGDD